MYREARCSIARHPARDVADALVAPSTRARHAQRKRQSVSTTNCRWKAARRTVEDANDVRKQRNMSVQFQTIFKVT